MHGIVEGKAEDLDEKINGVSGQIALGPAPVGVFYDETGMGGQSIIARLLCDELESLKAQSAPPPLSRTGHPAQFFYKMTA